MFYRQRRLVIDGKYSSDDGLSTTVKMAGSECACEDSLEAQKSKNPLGIQTWKLRRNNIKENALNKSQDTGVRRGEGRQRSIAIGSHSENPSAVRSDRSCTRFTIGKIQGEIPIERGPSDLNIDKKRTEQEDRSQTLDLSVGPDHRWIKENLHTF